MGCGQGKAEQVHDALRLRRGSSAAGPSTRAARGRFSSALPPTEEGRRDFARIFFADESKISVVGRGMPNMRPLQPTAGPSRAHIGDLSEQVVERAEELFSDCLARQLKQVFGRPLDPALLAKLRDRASAAMTVNVGMDFALHAKLMPTFWQPFFLIIVIPELNEVRTATYGFVARRPEDVVGDRPESKRTPYCVRLLSPNLLHPSGASPDWEVEYSLRSVASSSIKQVVEGDLSIVREAIRTAGWDALL